MSNSKDDRDPGERLRYVFIKRPRCPACDRTRLAAYKTFKSDDHAVISRYTRCKDCGHRFIAIFE